MKTAMIQCITLALLGLFLPSCRHLGADSHVLEHSGRQLSAAVDWPDRCSHQPTERTPEAWAEALLNCMTVNEKVGQILMADIRSISPAEVREYSIGAILNGGSSAPGDDLRAPPSAWLNLADAYWDASVDRSDGGLGIPVLWGTDAVHGHNNVFGATIFPHNIGLGAANDADLVRRIARVTALEVRAAGQDWAFAPTLAVPQDIRWGRSYEGFSSDPERVGRLGAAAVEGLQGGASGDAILSRSGIVATAKHWVADGGTDSGKDQGDSSVSEDVLRELHIAPYIPAIDAGAQTVMASFSSWQGTPLHGHNWLLRDVLRGELGFDGPVVGDWNGHAKIDGCTRDDCPDALLAGIDMYMVPRDWKALRENLLVQVSDGTIPQARLDEAVRQILLVKLRAGLFEAGSPSMRGQALDLIGAPEHWALAREAVRRSLVLLKNDGVLPIRPTARILVAGEAADSVMMQSGGWTLTWQGTDVTNADFPDATTLLDGVVERAGVAGGEVVYSPDGSFAGPVPDVAIVAFGEQPYAEGVGDISTLNFDDETAVRQLRNLKAAGIPTVAVFLTGRPLYVSPEINASDAFVVAWLPGGAGIGMADLLIAEQDGSPRFDFEADLPFDWPSRPDGTGEPIFRLGEGLSYSEPGMIGKLPEVALSAALEEPGAYFVGGLPAKGRQLLAKGADGTVSLPGAIGALPGRLEVSAIDRNRQEDARQFDWSMPASIVLTGKPARAARTGATLQLDIQRLGASNGSDLRASLACAGGERATIALGEHLEMIEPGKWTRIEMPIQCAKASASDADLASFTLSASGPLSIGISDIRIDDP